MGPKTLHRLNNELQFDVKGPGEVYDSVKLHVNISLGLCKEDTSLMFLHTGVTMTHCYKQPNKKVPSVNVKSHTVNCDKTELKEYVAHTTQEQR